MKKNNIDIEIRFDNPLTSFSEIPKNATALFTQYITSTYKYIPDEKHYQTNLFILATGGMRLLNHKKAEKFLNTLKKYLPEKIRYKIAKIEIINGKMEGIFMWISLNYHTKSFKNCTETKGIIQSGSNSIEITFESYFKSDDTFDFNFTCFSNKKIKNYNIYSVSFDGLGENSAFAFYQNQDLNTNKLLTEPCLIKNCELSFKNKIKTGTGDVDKCFSKIQKPFQNFFENNRQKNLMDSYDQHHLKNEFMKNMKFFGFGGIWNWFNDFLKMAGTLDPKKYWIKIKVFSLCLKEFCSSDCKWHQEKLDHGYYMTNNMKHLR